MRRIDRYWRTRVLEFRPGALQYFGSRLSPAGVIVVDDYASQKCAGVAKAVGEYLQHADGFHVWDVRTEQLILTRR